MAQRSTVPKFGNWENGDNVPYTVYFEEARKSRNKGHRIESDPARQQNQHYELDLSRKSLDPPLQTDDAIGRSNGANVLRAKHRPADSPIYAAAEPPARVSSGKTNRRRNRNSEHSAAHLSEDRGGASPAYWRERKDSIGQGAATPGRSRQSSADDYAVPKFGEWDESNPASADGYTVIFNKLQQRRTGGSAKSFSASSNLSNPNSLTTQRRNSTSKSVSCFCWG